MRYRTTAIGVLLASLLAAPTAEARSGVPSPLVFPVLGEATFIDDFGQARPGGKHQGNDLIAPRKAIAVAAESGKVEFWTTSANAGCMLYLYGDSGTTYMYIHLNNDLGPGNDNKGKCVPGVAYASGLRNGDRVAAGEPVGYVGDSGDANGIHPHVHFEVHPPCRGDGKAGDHDGKAGPGLARRSRLPCGKAVSPYPFLLKAHHLFFGATAGETFTLVLSGTVTAVDADQLTLDVGLLREWPAHQRVSKPGTLTVTVPGDVLDLSSLEPGQKVTVWTEPAPASLDVQLGNGLLASKLVVKP
jgi:murein DD-endopeptidase MepM/ murein hydrolase activator NlpD